MVDSIFTTGSTNLAAFLYMNDIKPVQVTKINNQTYFLYVKTEELNVQIDNYNSNVELKEFISAFKKVKDISRK